MNKFSRRDFLKIAGSSVALGTLGSSFPSILKNKEVVNNLDKFEYIVVLMMENRSFDNVLGYLYTPDNPPPDGQQFEGVAYRNLSNPIPPYADSSFVGSIPVYKDSIMNNPNPDPGEEFPHINTSFFGTVIPDSNRFKTSEYMTAPFNLPDTLPEVYPMKGFLEDYINNFRATQGRMPDYFEYKIIMSCFPPQVVPVISTLAKEFAVCDHWHCSVPSQTFCNRSFFNSGASAGFVSNSPYPQWIQNTQETIFQRLAKHNKTWKIYFDHRDILPMSLMIHFSTLRPYAPTNVCSFEHFQEDCLRGELPQYTFIEPRLIFAHNDEHPPSPLIGEDRWSIFPSSVVPGEILINKVYNIIKQSESAKGNNWMNTLFIITYDEAGGTYDHVQPPVAVAPYDPQPPGEMGFDFKRLGVRVPTVIVSPYIKKGTVINQSLTHTSVIKTMSNKWGLGNLTRRDLNSPDLSNIFNLTQMRQLDTYPEITPRQDSVQGDKEFFLNKNLTEFQRDIIGIAYAHAYGNGNLPESVKTVKDGMSLLTELLKILKVSFLCS